MGYDLAIIIFAYGKYIFIVAIENALQKSLLTDYLSGAHIVPEAPKK